MDPIRSQIDATLASNSVTQANSLKRQDDLREATQGFEAIFLQTIMDSMRDTLPGNGIFKESNASDIYQSMHDQYLSEKLSQGKSALGLKERLYDQLKDRI